MKKDEFIPGSVHHRINRDYKIISKTYVDLTNNKEINELDFDHYLSAVEEYTWLTHVFPSAFINSVDYCIDHIGTLNFIIKKSR